LPKFDPGSPSGRNFRRRGTDENQTPDTAEEREKKIRDFASRVVERAFRRPLADDEKLFFVERQFAETPDEETAIKRVVLLALKSPRFLYRELESRVGSAHQDSDPDVGGHSPPYNTASRLSFALWDSLPDEALLDAAAASQLQTREQIAAQAERMLNDLRTRSKIREFLLQWLKVDQPPEIAKDKARFPEL